MHQGRKAQQQQYMSPSTRVGASSPRGALHRHDFMTYISRLANSHIVAEGGGCFNYYLVLVARNPIFVSTPSMLTGVGFQLSRRWSLVRTFIISRSLLQSKSSRNTGPSLMIDLRKRRSTIGRKRFGDIALPFGWASASFPLLLDLAGGHLK